MNPLRIFLLAALVLVVFGIDNVEAEKEPEWTYETELGYSVAISADGEYIAAINDDKVYLFHKDDSTPLWNYTAEGTMLTVAISADGEYIAVGSQNDDKVYLFHKDGSTPLWNYTTGNEPNDYVSSVAISADGEYIAAGSGDHNVYLFHKNSSTPLWSYETGSYVSSVAISADGEYIVAGDTSYSTNSENNVHFFNKNSSTPLWSTHVYMPVFSVAISADGEYIAVGTERNSEYTLNKVYLFDKDSSTPLWNYTTEDRVNSVAISADGEYITAGSLDNKTYLFSRNSSTPHWSYTTGGNVIFVAISANGKYIAAISFDDKVHFFHNNYSRPTVTIDSITPSPVIYGDDVFFDGSSSDEDGTIVRYEWLAVHPDLYLVLSDKEDFEYSSWMFIPYTNYEIIFRAYDDAGNWGEDTAYLVLIFNQDPIALIDSIAPSPARFDDEITFNGTGSDSDGNISSYEWLSCLSSSNNPSPDDCEEWEGDFLFLSDLEDFTITDLDVGKHFIFSRNS